MLRVTNLCAAYKGIEILHRISFTINKGEWISLIGLNGSGKSTLVNTLMGFNKDTKGKVTYRKNEDLLSLSPQGRLKKGISCVLEGRQLFNSLTVSEHFDLFKDSSLKQNGYDLFPILFKKKNELAKNLSGGQQQMLAIALALINDPDFIILDEPSLGLAPHVMDDIWECLKKLHKRKKTILLIEQNMMSALSLCNRALIMTDGVIAFDGKPKTLLKDQDQLSYYLSFEDT